eukprot:NODE_1317_length_459_cov_86.524096_g1307_i0.p2 GENE.NODE_1317_length_459_cov_86.524096_g1307_i0~~NODE_1317_length_459_cov_86.524096_g1307_i0.p2  ORF type:complete len:110 (+),score=38.08 NODE_1317_length_459_cov_86.524096_g1307_i0:45-374(+)
MYSALWYQRRVHGGSPDYDGYRLPSSLDGKQLSRFTENRFVQACDGNRDFGSFLYKELHSLMKATSAKNQARSAASRQAQAAHKMQAAAKAAGIRAPAPKNPQPVRNWG